MLDNKALMIVLQLALALNLDHVIYIWKKNDISGPASCHFVVLPYMMIKLAVEEQQKTKWQTNKTRFCSSSLNFMSPPSPFGRLAIACAFL